MRQQGVMKASMTWSPAAGLNVVSVERGGQAWTITLGSQQLSVCPGCGARSKSRHSTYWRTLRDLSAQELRLLLTLASGAGGVDTSCAIAAFALSACRVSHHRSRVGPSASRKLSG